MQQNKKLWEEAKARGEEYEVAKLRRHTEMDEYDYMQWRRSFEEREALLRDISWYCCVDIFNLIPCYDALIFHLSFSSFFQSQSSWAAIGRARKVCGC